MIRGDYKRTMKLPLALDCWKKWAKYIQAQREQLLGSSAVAFPSSDIMLPAALTGHCQVPVYIDSL